MKKTKFLALILSLIMVSSTVAVIPLTVSATEGEPSSTAFESTLIVHPGLMTVDAAEGTGEIWESISNVLNFNMFQTSHNSTTSAEDETVATLKIANDGEYIYFFVDATKARNELELMIEHNGTLICNATRGGEDQMWINNGTTNSSSKGNGWYQAETRSSTSANAVDAQKVEVRFTMPDELKTAVAEGDVEVEVTMYLQTGTYGTGTSWEDGFALDGTVHTGNATTIENGQTVILKQAVNAALTERNPIVQNVIGANINVNGVMDDGEGWAELPYAVLDKLDSTPYDEGGLTNVNNVAPTIRISTDGDYLYAFVELTDSQSIASNDTDNQLYMTWKFGDTDIYKLNIYTSKAMTYEGTGSDAANTTYNTEGTPLREILLGADSVDYLKLANVLVDGKRTIEIALKLSPTVKSALMDGDVTAGFASYMRTNSPSTNYGYTSESCLYATGGYWSNVAKTGNLTLPSYNESRPVIAGVQTRESSEVENAVDVRFVAALSDANLLAGTADACKYSEAGFDFTSNGKTVSINCWNLYKSLLAAGEPVTPDTYGGDFFFCYTIQGLEAGNSYDFSVKCWTKEADVDKVYSAYTYDVTVAVDADGTATITSSIAD